MYRNRKLLVLLVVVLAALAGVLLYLGMKGNGQEDMRGTLVKLHCPVRMVESA